MRIRLLQSLIFSVAVFSTIPAMALIEFNVGGQGLLSNSPGGNWTGNTGTNYNISGGYGLQADLRFNLPFGDWQLGARYGQIGISASNNGYNLAMNATTYSGLLAYRLINTGILFGPVLTYAIGGSGTLQNSLSSAGSSTITAGSISQYTAGLEVGIKFPILVELEVGYGNLTMNSFGTQTISGNATNVALAGTYARASIGFSF